MVSNDLLRILCSTKNDFGLLDMQKKSQLSIFDLDIENLLGRGTLAKYEPFLYPSHCWWCWRALLAAINTFVKSLNFADHHPIRIGGERERLVTASPVMTKSRDPAGGSNYPENGLVKPPRRDTRAPSPAGMFRGKTPPRLAAAEEQTARTISAYAQCACLPNGVCTLD